MLGLSASAANSQVINETVSLGASYVNEVWYTLSDGTETAAPKAEWDLAFSVDGFSSSIRVNNGNGVELYAYPNGTNADWNSVDASDIANWEPLYNSYTDWEIGAFDVNLNPNIQFDYGWGVYNMSTHFVTGDSLFVIKLADGSLKKLDIINLANGSFNFRYGNLDNSEEVTTAFVKSDYAGKMFGYYSIVTDEFIDREPAEWDLLFKKYIGYVPTPYAVTGILAHPNWTIAEATGIADPATYTDFQSETFGTDANTIGDDWKTFNMTSFQYDIAADRVYFMQNEGGDIWKIIPTGFGGSATGDVEFSKEQLTFAGLTEENQQFVSIYPNPATDNLTISFDSKSATTTISVKNSIGQIVATETFNSATGLTQKQLNISHLDNGVYFIEINQNNSTTSKSVIKQ